VQASRWSCILWAASHHGLLIEWLRCPHSRSLLKHNKFKPASLELKEDLDLEEQSLNAILQAKAAAALGAKTTLAAASCTETAAALAVRARPSSSHPTARGSSVAQFDGGPRRAHPCRGLCVPPQRVNGLIARYNAAVLSDRETYGARWPLPTRAPVALDELWRVTIQQLQPTDQR
jgi:hypothetical protein